MTPHSGRLISLPISAYIGPGTREMSGRAVIDEYYKIRLYFNLYFIDVIDLPTVGIQFNFVIHVLILLGREACTTLKSTDWFREGVKKKKGLKRRCSM